MTTPTQPQYAPPLPPPGAGYDFKAADLVVAIGGALIFFFSFAPYVDGGFYAPNSWHLATTVFVALAGLCLCGSAFLGAVWGRDKLVIGFHREGVQVGLAMFTLVNLFAFMIDFHGWGVILQFLGALAGATGALLNHFNLLQNPLSLPEQPPAYPPQAYYYPPQPTPPQPATQEGSTQPPAPQSS